MSVPGALSISPRILLGPGPSDVHPRILTAMATPVVGHTDPQFLQVMNDTQEMLRTAYQTSNPLTFPISATGMAGMETCVVNLVEPGDRVVVCVNGFFGGRMVEIASRAGAQVTVLERPWGEVFDLNQIRETLQKVRPKVLGIVQAETSTGALQPLEGLGQLCHEHDTLLLVDAVTALGCVPLRVDDWEIDAVYSCSQKGLSCPPGLSPISFSPRAIEAMNRRNSKVQSWYFDLSLVQKYWIDERVYHHTGPITMTYALREGLRILHEEGLEARWARHVRNHKAFKAGAAVLGLRYSAAEKHQLPQLNAVLIPQGADDLTVRKAAVERVRHRDRRRPRRVQGQGVAHRADGLRQPAEQCAAAPGGAGAVPRVEGWRRGGEPSVHRGVRRAMTQSLLPLGPEVLERMVRAVEAVRNRMLRATAALEAAGVPYAVVGGNAVAVWVARANPAAVRNTADVDLLLRRQDLDAATAALSAAGFIHAEVFGVEMFLDGPEGNPRDAVHVLFAGEKVKPGDLAPAPDVSETEAGPQFRVVNLDALVRMKLTSWRDKDRTHLRDMLEIGLLDVEWLPRLPGELAARLQHLLDTPGG